MKLKDITDKSFISSPLAMTDIHNGGSIFGVIYHQVLTFNSDETINLKNEIDHNSGMDWDKSIKEDYWEGTYQFESEMKHVKCELINQSNQNGMTIFADIMKGTHLVCEVYITGEAVSESRVYLYKE